MESERKGPFTVRITSSYHPLPVAILRVVLVLPILILSIGLYLTGLLLTLTVVGAIIGIPLILATYALDVLALSLILHPRLKTQRVRCPSCGKGKRVLPSVMDLFRCNRCKSLIRLETLNPGERP